MLFYTAINCMDGRVQLPVINYLRERFSAEYIDSITEPGPVVILAEKTGSEQARSILARVEISLTKHKSGGIALIAHYDCAGNPAPESVQREQLVQSLAFLHGHYPTVEIIGLWVDSNWQVKQVCSTAVT